MRRAKILAFAAVAAIGVSATTMRVPAHAAARGVSGTHAQSQPVTYAAATVVHVDDRHVLHVSVAGTEVEAYLGKAFRAAEEKLRPGVAVSLSGQLSMSKTGTPLLRLSSLTVGGTTYSGIYRGGHRG